MEKVEQEDKKLFAACGWDMQFVAGLSLLGAGSFLVAGIVSGSWGEFCGRAMEPATSRLVGLGATGVCLVCLVLGQYVKRGSHLALLVSANICGLAAIALLWNLLTIGTGVWEVFLWGTTAVITLGTLFASERLKRARDTRPDSDADR
ncbi:MAG: hypothetical protein GY842_10520 [bacterium]|nr:hypothetical protein [bacterium]